ncbi:peptide/nickel transport system substrate-binding protein [Catalinimonas alkaloidigena]|uniref:Peptide/nickel transport system substrate-binding protein n=1 Tax=Catalinimonas alkaloidigena TaxID=1075417 RepID=A0A1G9Q221_9BACT|nr:ABC transporter substrate-binding protein [Catalinimonas alkaloidigena]SDM05049.1 peptide/nickel transport system substrate-binding protein [Catalinimonas alkaloidigena]
MQSRVKITDRIVGIASLMGWVSLLWLCACQPEERSLGQVNIHLPADPGKLNPYQYTSSNAGVVVNHLFQSLLGLDPVSQEILPVLAARRPSIETRDTLTYIHYEVRPEAQWDDGSPITGWDVAFSLKVIRNPLADLPIRRSLIEFIKDVRVDSANARKVMLVCRDEPLLLELTSGDFDIVPENRYDSTHTLRTLSLEWLGNLSDTTGLPPILHQLARNFDSEVWAQTSPDLVGSGPYQLSQWDADQQLVLVRKPHWWADRVTQRNVWLEAIPEKIRFRVISDYATAGVALQNGKLDFIRGVPFAQFEHLQRDPRMRAKFDFRTPAMFGYNFVAINHQHPLLRSRLTRQALAYLVDYDYLLNTIQQKMGRRTSGPYDPERLDGEVAVKYQYDPQKAQALLQQDGWCDLDRDGVLEKEVNGQRTPFQLVYKYNAGNEQRRAVGILLQETARKVGIDIRVQAEEWGKFTQSLASGDFGLSGGSFSFHPVANDYTQIFHSESIATGGNYVHYRDTLTDRLLDSIRYDAGEPHLDCLYTRLYHRIQDEVPLIFLDVPYDRIVVSKAYTNTHITGMSPGCWPAAFTPAEQAAAN